MILAVTRYPHNLGITPLARLYLPLSRHMLLEDLAGDDQVFSGNLRRALWVLPFVLGDLLPLGAIFV